MNAEFVPGKHAGVFGVGDEKEHLKNILCPARSEKGEKKTTPNWKVLKGRWLWQSDTCIVNASKLLIAG